jgi:hypothetical protein
VVDKVLLKHFLTQDGVFVMVIFKYFNLHAYTTYCKATYMHIKNWHPMKTAMLTGLKITAVQWPDMMTSQVNIYFQENKFSSLTSHRPFLARH